MFEFLAEHPLLSSFILLLLYSLAIRFGRLMCIVVRGWPPKHLVAAPHLQAIKNALGTDSDTAVLAFLTTPHGGLDGDTPMEALRRGQVERVLQLAGADGL